MKLLVLASTLDLKYRLGCTPSWWQLLKGLHETGNEVLAIPYLGDPVESLWWRTYPNPCSAESKLFYHVSNFRNNGLNGKAGVSARASRVLIDRLIRPKWKKHLHRVLSEEKDIDAILMMNIPVNHFAGIPSEIKQEFGVKVAYYEGDMPTILPRYAIDRGFKFNYYEGADLSEYDVFFTNSKGAISDIRAMGARNVHPLYWAADPELFRPVEVEKNYDIAFYGHGSQLREEWLTKLVVGPSEALPKVRFVVGGQGFSIPLGRAERVGRVGYAAFGRFVGRSKINLNITRESHTHVYASATSRPFELAAYGACIVSQPYNGIDEWFAVGKELVIAPSSREAIEIYQWLLGDEEAAQGFGRKARERVLREHTFHHRAKQAIEVIRAAT